MNKKGVIPEFAEILKPHLAHGKLLGMGRQAGDLPIYRQVRLMVNREVTMLVSA